MGRAALFLIAFLQAFGCLHFFILELHELVFPLPLSPQNMPGWCDLSQAEHSLLGLFLAASHGSSPSPEPSDPLPGA